ncbi:efflux RND transporter periplasmic adaptor subunit [Ferrimonas marina]|uniref:Membrane fusion protein, multidrug efflux system n=1 Tax=Ferrimonas marina TaxID=299255 RepID=A0A1M5RC29_9GAMM|nr:efflux RND transporter periplasmic adaptor subunit [Ferrimonas marina]SHH23363.1 membrane fusion protein, multidrug efflux system [Ferrimonas marina]
MRTSGTAAIVGLALLAGAVAYKEWQATQTQAQVGERPAPRVVVAEARMEPMAREVEALGTVRARESVVLSAKITEKVEQVHFEDGDVVEQGQLLVTLRDGEQQAKLQAAQANLTEQEREYRRIEGLVKAKTIASNELDKILTDIDVAKATLAQYQAELDARYIRAPFSGLLGFRAVSPGALVTPERELTTLDDLSVVKLDFPVPERFLAEIRPGKQVLARAAAYPNQTFEGRVTGIDSRVDPTTRAVVVRAEINNAELQLRPGMLMSLQLIVEQRQGVVVPEAALVPRQQNQYVFVVDADNKVVQRQVVLGMRKRGSVEIVEGLQTGEKVITLGTNRVRPGQQVQTEKEESFTGERAV